MKRYLLNEIFYSLQGEGARAGSANLFVRFSGCNLDCKKEPGAKSPGGWDCDTDHSLKLLLTGAEIISTLTSLNGDCRSVVLTGGEPGLQVDSDIISLLKRNYYYVAIETNGTLVLPDGIDWITVSPKLGNAQLPPVQVFDADEVRHVLAEGQEPQKSFLSANRQYISPAFSNDVLSPANLLWCIDYVKRNPKYFLTIQQHKVWKIK